MKLEHLTEGLSDVGKELIDHLPDFHRECAEDAQDIRSIAAGILENYINKYPGIKNEWEDLNKGNLDFNELYLRYINDSKSLVNENPEAFAFIRNRIFHGLELVKEELSEKVPEIFHKAFDFGESNDKEDTCVSECVKAIKDIPSFKPEIWEGLSSNERSEALNSLAERTGGILGVPVCGAIFDNMPSTSRGYYSADGFVHLNSDVLKNPEYLVDALDTVFHESRHAFQRLAAANPENYGIDNKLAKLWGENIINYCSPELDFEAYNNQPIEADARAFAQQVISSGLGICENI